MNPWKGHSGLYTLRTTDVGNHESGHPRTFLSSSLFEVLLKALRIWWLFWQGLKLVMMLYIWVVSSGFQSGFINFFLFYPQSSTKNYWGRCGLSIYFIKGHLWILVRKKGMHKTSSRALVKLPQFFWFITKPGEKENFTVFSRTHSNFEMTK